LLGTLGSVGVGRRRDGLGRKNRAAEGREHLPDLHDFRGEWLPDAVRENTVVARQLEPIVDFRCRLDADVQESGEFFARRGSATLDDVARDRFRRGQAAT
jgi:hypothetical protein